MNSQPQQNKVSDQRAFKRQRVTLLVLCAFVGLGALGGGGLALISPDGTLMSAQLLIPALQKIPIAGPYLDSLTLPACALLLFVFIPQTLATILLIRKHSRQYPTSILCGCLLSLFTIGEIILIFNLLSFLFLAFGVLEVGLALACRKHPQHIHAL